MKKTSRIPLQKFSNSSIYFNSQQNTSTNTNKRQKLSAEKNNIKKPTTMASIIQNVTTNTKMQMDDISKLKNDKMNDLSNLNSEIWKIQTKIPDIELKLEKLNLKLSNVKSNFQILECKIKNLSFIKTDKLNSINKSFETFKKNLNTSFDEKVTKLAQFYDEKVTNIINEKNDKFKKIEDELLKEIETLQSSINDYSDKILNESKETIKSDIKLEISKSIEKHKENMIKMNESILSFNNDIVKLEKNIEDLSVKYNTETKTKLQDVEKALESLNNDIQNLQDEEIELNYKLSTLNDSKEEECNKLLKLQEETRQLSKETINYNLMIKEEEQYRRFLHNQLQEMKGNIRVFCRIKPEKNIDNTFKHEIQSMMETSDLKESLVISEPENHNPNNRLTASPTKKTNKQFSFSFDKIFDESSTNGEIFEEISQLVQSSLDGFNVCIFTYGQTGSGKTYTMSNLNDGLIPRSMKLMFERIKILKSLNKDYQLYGQFFEIYGEKINDLIDDSINKGIEFPNKLFDSEINNIKMIKLESTNQIDELLEHSTSKRSTAFTMANDASSRSHSIFRVYITTINENNETLLIGTLNLVDLAGSERLSQSQVTGIRLKETLAINKSLSSLGDVILNLKSKSSHIPYRNSKLTYILKDSLGGDSKTLMFVNISCLNSHFNESLSSLRFASKVNNTVLK